jgi:hypothetical protein
MRREAVDAAERLQALIEDQGNAESELESLASHVAFHCYDWDEGQPVPLLETYDPNTTIQLATQTAAGFAVVRTEFERLTGFFLDLQESSRQTASVSLRYSYSGLFFVAAGFVLQFLGSFPQSGIAKLLQLSAVQ